MIFLGHKLNIFSDDFLIAGSMMVMSSFSWGRVIELILDGSLDMLVGTSRLKSCCCRAREAVSKLSSLVVSMYLRTSSYCYGVRSDIDAS